MKLHVLLIAVLFSMISFSGFAGGPPKARTMIISGKIADIKSNELLSGVKIECAGCSKVVYSDLEGRFFLYLEVDSQEDLKLEFSQIGYSSKVLDIQALQSSSGEVVINLESE